MAAYEPSGAAARACMIVGTLIGVGVMLFLNASTHGKVPGGAIGGAIGGGVGGAPGALVGHLFSRG